MRRPCCPPQDRGAALLPARYAAHCQQRSWFLVGSARRPFIRAAKTKKKHDSALAISGENANKKNQAATQKPSK
jgi:hypothetical protein